MRRAAVVVFAAAIVVGCSAGDDGTSAPDPETTDDAIESDATTATAESTPVTTTDDTAAPDTTDETAAPDTTAAAVATTAPPTTEPAAAFFGGFPDVVVQHTPEAGGGFRPELQWDAIDGADHYGVYLYAPSGDVYWSWRGMETQVFVGGAIQLSDSAPGPSVADGMSWAVIAYDADLIPVAASPMRPIAP